MVQRPLWQRLYYRFWWFIVRLILLVAYRVRVHDENNIPLTGGVMLMANHQSHLDPPCIGAVIRRRCSFLARKTLFKWPFSLHIAALDAIPLDQEGIGASGIKETLRRLRNGEAVLIFPEGSRSWDGEIGPMMPGVCAIARRSGVPLLPVAIAGAHEAWRRGTSFPKLTGVIHILFGEPFIPQQTGKCDDDKVLAEVDRRIRACFERARTLRRRAMEGLP